MHTDVMTSEALKRNSNYPGSKKCLNETESVSILFKMHFPRASCLQCTAAAVWMSLASKFGIICEPRRLPSQPEMSLKV
jgi:hypothetical protein